MRKIFKENKFIYDFHLSSYKSLFNPYTRTLSFNNNFFSFLPKRKVALLIYKYPLISLFLGGNLREMENLISKAFHFKAFNL